MPPDHSRDPRPPSMAPPAGGQEGAVRLRRSADPSRDDADREVLALIVKGRVDGLDLLYRRYGRLAYSIARRITADDAGAEDVVQEAFLRAWLNASAYDAWRGSVKTWLIAIVHHGAVDVVRRRRSVPIDGSQNCVPAYLVVPDIWDEVSIELDAEAVRVAIASLSAPQRAAISLAYFGGLTQAEIADRTGTPLGTVKSRMRLGLLALRRALESRR